MNRRKRGVGLTMFVTGAVGFVLACGSISPYPPADNTPYPAGFQVGAVGGGTGGGTDGGGCFAFGEGGVFCPDTGTLESSLPDTSIPPCTTAGCSVVSTAANNPQSITLDPTTVYWTESNGNPWLGTPQAGNLGTVRSIARPGGVGFVATDLAFGLSGPFILKRSGSNLAFSALAGLGAGMTAAQTLPVTGGSPATPGPGLHNVWGVAIDATNVYWVESDSMAISTIVASAPIGGGAVTTLGTTATALLPQGMAITSTDIYFVGYVAGAGGTPGLYTLPITGGSPTLIWSKASPSQPADVTLDGSNVYWTDMAAGAVYSMPLGGGAASTMATGIANPRTIAVDSKNVYFTADQDIYEVPIGGTSPKSLASIGPGMHPYAIAADDGADNLVYFSTPTDVVAVGK